MYVCRCFRIGYHNLFTSHGGVRLYIAGGSNCSLANLLSPKQLVWVNAILAGYQCLTSPVYQFITQTQSKQQGIEICSVLELGTTNRWRHQWICSFKTWGEPGVDCCTLRWTWANVNLISLINHEPMCKWSNNILDQTIISSFTTTNGGTRNNVSKNSARWPSKTPSLQYQTKGNSLNMFQLHLYFHTKNDTFCLNRSHARQSHPPGEDDQRSLERSIAKPRWQSEIIDK